MTKIENVHKAELLLRALGEVLQNEVMQLADDQDENGGPLSARGVQRLDVVGPQVLAYAKAAKELLSESVAAQLTDSELQAAIALSDEIERMKAEGSDA